MEAYYIEESPFLYDKQNAWSSILEFLYSQDAIIVETIQDLSIYSDEDRKKIIKEMYEDQDKRKNISLTNYPYLRYESLPSIAVKYNLDEEMYRTINDEWLQELQETNITQEFIVYSKGILPIFWTNGHETVILASDLFISHLNNNEGCNFELWNVKLNEIVGKFN